MKGHSWHISSIVTAPLASTSVQTTRLCNAEREEPQACHVMCSGSSVPGSIVMRSEQKSPSSHDRGQ